MSSAASIVACRICMPESSCSSGSSACRQGEARRGREYECMHRRASLQRSLGVVETASLAAAAAAAAAASLRALFKLTWVTACTCASTSLVLSLRQQDRSKLWVVRGSSTTTDAAPWPGRAPDALHHVDGHGTIVTLTNHALGGLQLVGQALQWTGHGRSCRVRGCLLRACRCWCGRHQRACCGAGRMRRVRGLGTDDVSCTNLSQQDGNVARLLHGLHELSADILRDSGTRRFGARGPRPVDQAAPQRGTGHRSPCLSRTLAWSGHS